MTPFDIVIVGGGTVGLSLACGLQNSSLRIALLEQRAEDDQPLAIEPLLRVCAINPASERLFRHLDVWNDIITQRVSPYRTMEVWERDSFARINFRADDYGYTHLGHIIENEVVQRALWKKAQQSSDITLFSATSLKQIAWGENEAFITLNDDRQLSTKLVVGADGAESWLRKQADIPVTFRDYQHHALVATIRCAEPHGDCARQIFYGDAILAFLPLWQEDLCSIVWALPAEEAQRLQQLDEKSFNQALSIAFDNRLGLCSLESERLCLPLTARYARNFAKHRLALVGDAAHTIHPLAGQGVNLGLMDVIELITEIKRLRKQGKDIGSYMYLRSYERSRKYGAVSMLAAMQGLRSVFAGTHPVKKLLRDVGLTLTDRLPLAKSMLVSKAIGIDELPEWLT